MSASIIRMKKEARALFWPWLAVTLAGTLPVVLPHARHGIFGAISALGFFVGFPLLATLSLGHEFQHGTLSLWLTQPTGRMQIWGEKLIVSFAAVLSTALVFGIGRFPFTGNQHDLTLAALAIAYVIVAVASATFWTLTARSTLGGLALFATNIGVFEIIFFSLFGFDMDRVPASASTISAIVVFGIGYAGLMLFLGARKLARFQATGASAGDDLLMSGPALMPGALAEWFRCRPTGSFLNLIRKELHLLRPLWLITLLSVLLVACLAMFRSIPDLAQPGPLDAARFVVGMLMLFFLILAILAGSLSLGEERTSGTQSWHMTLPVSARRQWLIKLSVAMLAGLLCAVAFPLLVLIAAGSIYGSPSLYVNLHSLPGWLLAISILTFASFWCACAANGTVRAALWVFPVTNAVFFAGSGGMWLGLELARTTGTARDLVLSWFHLSPLAFTLRWVDPYLLLLVPAILLGVIQSYRLFRTQPQDSILWMMRCVLPLALVSLLCGFAVSAGFASSRWEPFLETRNALEKLQPGMTNLEVTGDDLARGAPLSSLTRHWLGNSRITVAPDKAHSSGYRATIRLASGVECRLTVAHYGGRAFSPENPSCAHRAP